MQKSYSKLVLPALLAAALLAGCGGDSSGGTAVAPAAPDIATNIDDLFKFMSDLIAGTSDSTDPISINALTLATDDTASPTPLN